MEVLASLFHGYCAVLDFIFPQPADPKHEEARVRLALKEEQAKPAGQRNEKRLLALREDDKILTYRYCRVCRRARLVCA